VTESRDPDIEMKTVQRSEIVDYVTYQETREVLQRIVFVEKERRRIQLGDHFTFLFENAMTIRYQAQEMMRVEKTVREKDILHELDTYNSILGGDGELGCTLMIGIEDPKTRDLKLREWVRLPEHLYVLLPDGTRINASFDGAQRDEFRLSSVQYLKFAVQGVAPVAIAVDLPGCEAEARLTDDQRAALQEDLA
jgi:hypothetical protein